MGRNWRRLAPLRRQAAKSLGPGLQPPYILVVTANEEYRSPREIRGTKKARRRLRPGRLDHPLPGLDGQRLQPPPPSPTPRLRNSAILYFVAERHGGARQLH